MDDFIPAFILESYEDVSLDLFLNDSFHLEQALVAAAEGAAPVPVHAEPAVVVNPVEVNGTVFVCSKCPNFFSTSNQLVHHTIHFHNTFTCHACSRDYASARSLSNHVKKHNNPTAVPCLLCEQVFQSNWLLRRHRESVHGERRNCACPNCPATFSRPDSLHRHLQSFHHD